MKKTTINNLSDPMNIAFTEAKKAFNKNEVPVGAVVTDINGHILAKAYNLVESKQDPTAHAEILVIKKATIILKNKYLIGCSLYVTLEPCPMCAAAIQYSKISKLFFGCEDEKNGAINNGVKIFNQNFCNHKPEIYDGIRATECSDLLKKFFRLKRK